MVPRTPPRPRTTIPERPRLTATRHAEVEADDSLTFDVPSQSEEDDRPQTPVQRNSEDKLFKMFERIERRLDSLEESQRSPPRSRSRTPRPSPRDFQTPPAPPLPTFKEPKVTEPPEYSGKVSEFRAFFTQIGVVFTLRPSSFPTDETKVLYVISRLRGSAMNWSINIAEDVNHPLRHDYEEFKQQFKSAFQDTSSIQNAENKICSLRQTASASDYASEFHSLATYIGLENIGKRLLFYQGLKPHIQRALAISGKPQQYDELRRKAIEIDQAIHLSDRKEYKPQPSSSQTPSSLGSTSSRSQPTSSNNPDQRQKSAFRPPLTEEEKAQRRKEGRCAYCGDRDHQVDNCPRRQNFKGQRPTNQIPTPSPSPAPAYSAAIVPPSRASSTNPDPIRVPSIYPGNELSQDSARREY